MSLEEMAATLAANSLLLNNLFQHNTGEWICSIRDAKNSLAFEFARGDSPSAAITLAIHRALHEPGSPIRQSRPKALAAPKLSGVDLLQTLGLS